MPTIYLDEVIHPRLVTLSGLPEVTTGEEPRHTFNATTRGSYNILNPSVLSSPSNPELDPLLSLYSVSGAATYKSES